MAWVEKSEVDDAHIVLRNAITEIAGLRARLEEHRLAIRRLAEQDATLSVQGGNVTVTMDFPLTDAEREAIESAISDYEENDDDADCARMVSTLRGLLERLGAT